MTAEVAVPSRWGDGLVATGTLARFMLRRDRVKFWAWVGGIGLYQLYVSTAVPYAYGSDEDLASTVGLFADPVGRLLAGPGFGTDEPTVEGLVANGYGLYGMLLAALMSILLVVRHTRLEEQTGRSELVRANVVGRHAPLAATLAVAGLTNLAVAGVIILTMIGVGGFGATGSLVLAASTGAVGLAFAGIATITVQLTTYARAAAGMAGGVLGLAFVARAAGDMVRPGGSALSWASPLGWAQQTAPFVLDRLWPLALLLALAAASSFAGYQLSLRRDHDASMFDVRPGPAGAHPSLGTPWGLALRLNRAAMLGWGISLAVSGALFGAFSDALLDAADDLPDVLLDVLGAADVLDGYLAYMSTFMAYLISVFAILAVQGLHTDETRGRTDPILAAPVGRSRWLRVNLSTIAVAVVLMSTVVGAATGAGAAVMTGDVSHIWSLTGAALNQVPAVWLVLGVSALAYGARPRLIGGVWAILAYAVIVGTFGSLIDLPQVLFDLSPFEHPAELPIDDVRLAPLAALTVIGAALAALAIWTFARRDISVA